MSQTNQPKYELIVRKDSEGRPHPWRDILRAMDAGDHRNRRSGAFDRDVADWHYLVEIDERVELSRSSNPMVHGLSIGFA